MDLQRRSRIYSLSVLGHRLLQDTESKHTGYSLEVQGTTRFMHQVAVQRPPTFRLTVRFQAFRELHQQLSTFFPAIPPFPGQRILGSKTAAALDRRVMQLNSYFAGVMSFPEVQSSEPVLRLITPKEGVKLGVVGYKGSGKRELMQYIIGTLRPDDPRADVTADLPVDIVVDERLCRVRSVTPVHCDEYTDDQLFIRAMCSSLHAVVILYDEARKAHMERLDSLVTIPSAMVTKNEFTLERVYEVLQEILRHVR